MFMTFGMFILLIALVLFGVLAFKQLNALLLAPIVTIFVLVCSGLPILEGLKTNFIKESANYVTNYFFVFFTGALFGAVYQFTGAAVAVAKLISKLLHGKFVAPVIMIITGVLTYGGISGFVVFFCIYPIALQLFRENNMSRMLIPAAISAGTWTWSMTGPGSPSIQNVTAMTNLGTPASAAFTPSLIITIIEFVLIFVWLEYRARWHMKKGNYFDDPRLKPLDPEELKADDVDVPNGILSLLPIVLILVCFNGFDIPVEAAVMYGTILAMIMFWRRVGGGKVSSWVEVFNKGAANGGVAILNTAIVVGFAGVVKNTPAFSELVERLLQSNMSPYWFVAITVAVAAGAAGSASGGMAAAFSALKDTYIGLGANLEYVHRISAIAAGTLDTLPHQGAQITLLSLCKMTHKDSYFDIFVTQLAIPIIIVAIFIPLAQLGM